MTQISESKICTYCKKHKPIERFRIRYKKGYKWRQGKCMDCESKWARVHNYNNRDVRREVYRLNINGYRDKVKANYEKHKVKTNARMKIVRATPEWKERQARLVKKWYDKNKHRATLSRNRYAKKVQAVINSGLKCADPELLKMAIRFSEYRKRYMKNRIETLTDAHIAYQLKRQGVVYITPEMIEIKRCLILIKRKCQ